jgi:FHS family L-fucose permease-like MFS transporter
MKYKTFPILLVFLCMGFGDAVGPLVGLAKEYFKLSNFMAQLIPSVGFIMFGILSVPTGVLQDRTGKKIILLLGLIIAFAGLVIPIFGLKEEQYLLLLGAIFLLGAGASILQVAGNPIMRDVSSPENFSRNLTIGQTVKVIGSMSASLIPFAAAKWLGMDFRILFPIYSGAMLVTIIFVGLTPIQEHKDPNAKPATLRSCLALLGNKYILVMVLGIFIYVGTEVSFSSHIAIYLSGKYGFDLKTWGILGNTFFFSCLFIGRFLGSVVLNWISAKNFLILTVLMAIAGLLGLLFIDNLNLAIVSIMLAGMGCANVFPLIFSITVNSMPQRTNEISGLMVTAIVGGAFVPPLVGLVTDSTMNIWGLSTAAAVTMGFIVPLACTLYLLFVSLISLKQQIIAYEN